MTPREMARRAMLESRGSSQKRKGIDPTKPKIQLEDLIEKRRRCREAHRQGVPCTEFTPTQPTPIPIVQHTTPIIPTIPTVSAPSLQWAYGIMSVAQRVSSLLPKTIASLKGAGFDSPTLFIDGLDHRSAIDVEDNLSLTVVNRHPPNIKTSNNWILSLAELVMRSTTADLYALFQDDIAAVKGIRRYIETCHHLNLSPTSKQYPNDNTYNRTKGYLNLFTWGSNQAVCPKTDRGYHVGWYETREYNSDKAAIYHGRIQQTGRGAVGLVFNRDAVFDLLSHRDIVERPSVPHGWRAIDGGICQTLNKMGWREYVHNPSLLQHTGKISSIRNKPHQPSPSFPGEQFDAMTYLPQSHLNLV